MVQQPQTSCLCLPAHPAVAVQVMGPGCKIYALKRIKLAGRDEEAASGFIDEINLLNSLKDKPNIIQLVDSQVRGVEEGGRTDLCVGVGVGGSGCIKSWVVDIVQNPGVWAGSCMCGVTGSHQPAPCPLCTPRLHGGFTYSHWC